MSQLERIAYFTGGILFALVAGIIFGEQGRARRNKNQPPVEELAHQLKQAWIEHHTRA